MDADIQGGWQRKRRGEGGGGRGVGYLEGVLEGGSQGGGDVRGRGGD